MSPILWPPDAKSGLIGKDPDALKDWKWKSLRCPTLWDLMDCPGNSPDQNTGVGSLSLLHGIFPTQTEGKRKIRQQRMRWLDGITDSIGMNKLWETVEGTEAWHAAVHGVAKGQTWFSEWTTTRQNVPMPGTESLHQHFLSWENKLFQVKNIHAKCLCVCVCVH